MKEFIYEENEWKCLWVSLFVKRSCFYEDTASLLQSHLMLPFENSPWLVRRANKIPMYLWGWDVLVKYTKHDLFLHLPRTPTTLETYFLCDKNQLFPPFVWQKNGMEITSVAQYASLSHNREAFSVEGSLVGNHETRFPGLGVKIEICRLAALSPIQVRWHSSGKLHRCRPQKTITSLTAGDQNKLLSIWNHSSSKLTG